jgi:hypothetical protein
MATAKPPVVPAHIAQVWETYYGKDSREVLAVRAAFEWFAVLYREPDGGLCGVDFTGFGTDAENWQVSNDGIDFETVDEFKKGKLERGFL